MGPQRLTATTMLGIIASQECRGRGNDLTTVALGSICAQTKTGMASKATLLVAKFGPFTEAKLYDRAINERLDFGRSVARFACQSLTAFSTFKELAGADGKGIDRQELNASLKVLMKGELNDQEIDRCVQVLFEKGDSAPGANEADGEPRAAGVDELDRAEFIDLATDDRISFEFLAKAIQNKFKDHDNVDPSAGDMHATWSKKQVKPEAT